MIAADTLDDVEDEQVDADERLVRGSDDANNVDTGAPQQSTPSTSASNSRTASRRKRSLLSEMPESSQAVEREKLKTEAVRMKVESNN